MLSDYVSAEKHTSGNVAVGKLLQGDGFPVVPCATPQL